MATTDPYAVLGVSREASPEQIRRAYRRLVQMHHPDHNGGSVEAARRFEEIQAAYAQIREGQHAAPAGPRGSASGRGNAASSPRAAASAGEGAGTPQNLEARIAALEHELREARLAQAEAERARAAAERARGEARRAAQQAAGEGRPRPSDEELGYVHTEDSFSAILADAADRLGERLADAREHPAAKRAGEVVDELEELLRRHRPQR